MLYNVSQAPDCQLERRLDPRRPSWRLVAALVARSFEPLVVLVVALVVVLVVLVVGLVVVLVVLVVSPVPVFAGLVVSLVPTSVVLVVWPCLPCPRSWRRWHRLP